MALAVTERLAGRWFIFIADTAIAVDEVSAIGIEEGNPEDHLVVHLRSGRTVSPASFRGTRKGPTRREMAQDALDEVLVALAEIPGVDLPPVVEEEAPEREMLALPVGTVRPSPAALWVERLRSRLRL